MTEIRIDEHSAERSLRCPYCHDDIVSPSVAWECPSCRTPHHYACARENDKCTVLGCGARFTTPGTLATPLDVPAHVVDSDPRGSHFNAFDLVAVVCAALGLSAILLGFLLMSDVTRGGAALILTGCGVFVLAGVVKALEMIVNHIRRGSGRRSLRALSVALIAPGLAGFLMGAAARMDSGPSGARFVSAYGWTLWVSFAALVVGAALVGLNRALAEGDAADHQGGRS